MGKIMILNPMVEGGELFKGFFDGVEDVDVISLDEGPRITDGRMDIATACLDSVKKAKEAEKAGYQAIVQTCLGDPNLATLREAVRIPVLGTMQIAMFFCAMLSHRFSMLLAADTRQIHWEQAEQYGLVSRVTSIRVPAFGKPREEIMELSLRKPTPKEVTEPIITEAIKAIEDDGATALVTGCGYLTGLVSELSRQLKDRGFDVPFINPIPLAVDVARVVIKQKLSHSALAFPIASVTEYISRRV